MGSQDDGDVDCSPSWSSTANWTVVSGSLENIIAYESFYSPIDEEDGVDSCPKSHLILRRPSPESGPCEITLRFMEKHEIRQVYVRSTARVYEMYCATNSKSENEYLCTVRCGAAWRDEEVLHTTGTEGVSPSINGPDGGVAEANSQRGSNLNANEDDWVEVKAPHASSLDHKNSSSPSMSGADSMRIRQDFYEATAEMTDANPCTSLTIRLLSLQNKSIVCVDEFYVFANPVDSEEEGLVENSAQSSLMSMLVPTLLQLSKTTVSNKNNEGHTSNAEGIKILPKSGPKALDSTNNLIGVLQEGKSCSTVCDEVKLEEKNESDRSVCQSEVPLQVPVKERTHDEPFHRIESTLNQLDEVKLQEKNESDRSVCQSEVPLQVPVKERTHDEPFHRIESTLNQLVSRMDRIENYFLRFEENMLKPINSIEGRLKQVEEQLEVLTESHSIERPSCFRMSAPSFSGNESASNSFYNSGNDHPSCGPIEPDRKELHSGASPIALDISNSVGSSLLRPSLVVTAPEFSNSDDDQENQALEVALDSRKCKPKPSIDDVLASALAQFASSSSIKTPEYTKVVAEPPEFSNEDGNNYRKALSSDLSETETDNISSQELDNTKCTTNSASEYKKTVAVRPPEFLNEDGNNHRKALSSDLSEIEIDHISCSQEVDNAQSTTNSAYDGGNLSSFRHDHSSKIAGGDDLRVLKDPEWKYQSADGDAGVASAELSMKGTENGNLEATNGTSEDCVPDKSDIHLPGNGPNSTDADAVEVTTKEGCGIDIVHDVLGFSRDKSVVNYEIPILDVNFTSIANSSSDETLEDLLGDMPESIYGAPHLKEIDDSSPIGEQYDLILVEEEDQVDATSRTGPLSVDMNYYTIMGEPRIDDGKSLQDYCPLSNHNTI